MKEKENACGCGHEHEHAHPEIETCGCDHCHEHEKDENKALPIIITVLCAVAIGISFLPFFGSTVRNIILTAVILISGMPVFINAVKSISKLRIDESILLVIAVIAAFLLGEYFEAAVVSVLFRIGELMEDFASDRSRKSIEAIFGIVSDTANLVLPDGTLKKVDAEDIKVGDTVAVLPHETVPVDGVVVDGEGEADASALTGESLPVHFGEGSLLRSGMINGSVTVKIKASAERAQSSAARIVEMVEQAARKKGEAQRAVATFAKYYTPAIIAAAVLIAVVPSLVTGEWRSWIYRSLILLVASCPCAVVLSAPLAFFSSMGAAAKNGMIIKGSRYIEALAKADTVVFDKTGTLTTGELRVGEVYACENYTREDVISLAAKCEYYSTHPIAKAIVAENEETDISGVDGFTEIAGGGTGAQAPEGSILCGGERLMTVREIDISSLPKAPVYVALNGKAVGAIEIDGEVRNTAPETVRKLRRLGITKTVILTGDSAEQAKKVCEQCGVDEYKSGLLPDEKLSEFEEIKQGSKGIVYVGDGINDAPVLAASDVGVAMGLGTQAAGEAADVILTNSDLSRLSDTIYQSKRTMKILKSNIAFAIIVKFIVIALGIAGIAPMWSAIFADVGTMILCVMNSARLMKVKRY